VNITLMLTVDTLAILDVQCPQPFTTSTQQFPQFSTSLNTYWTIMASLLAGSCEQRALEQTLTAIIHLLTSINTPSS
jgi:hypothetical protein